MANEFKKIVICFSLLSSFASAQGGGDQPQVVSLESQVGKTEDGFTYLFSDDVFKQPDFLPHVRLEDLQRAHGIVDGAEIFSLAATRITEFEPKAMTQVVATQPEKPNKKEKLEATLKTFPTKANLRAELKVPLTLDDYIKVFGEDEGPKLFKKAQDFYEIGN